MMEMAKASRKPKTLNVFKSTVFNTAIDEALERSCHKGIKREPCYTAALTEELPKILNDKINNNARETGTHPKYRFGSCYVHQKPYVKFGPHFGLRRELGDLLVLAKRTINGTDALNSAVFQLKRTHGKKYSIPKCGGEDEQLTLYTKWGKLKIDLKSENTTVYDVTPHAVSQGGSYMFVREDRQCPKFVVAVPDREMETTALPPFGCYQYPQSLGVYLAGMVEWHCGRTIASRNDIKKGCADDWSKLMWRVIDLLENVSCSCQGHGVVKRDNGCKDLAFLMGYPEIDSLGESENMKSDSETTSAPNETGFGVLYIEELYDSEHGSERE